MSTKRRDTGRQGEKLAREFLKKQGFHIVESNYRCPEGEIDIIARHQDYLIFVEVRTKTGPEFGSPEESITGAKKKRLIAAAYHYRQAHASLPPLWRIDFVAVELDRNGKPSRIELIENAIGEA
ncbi:MAG: YraN family protein [Dehalococcoidales bacterium]